MVPLKVVVWPLAEEEAMVNSTSRTSTCKYRTSILTVGIDGCLACPIPNSYVPSNCVRFLHFHSESLSSRIL